MRTHQSQCRRADSTTATIVGLYCSNLNEEASAISKGVRAICEVPTSERNDAMLTVQAPSSGLLPRESERNVAKILTVHTCTINWFFTPRSDRDEAIQIDGTCTIKWSVVQRRERNEEILIVHVH